MSCKLCNMEFQIKENLSGRRKVFCSSKCRTRYNSRQRYYKKRVLNMSHTNPELHRRLVLDNYYENKTTWHSRVTTNSLVKSIKNIEIIMPRICFKCSSKENLEIHHETNYPVKFSKIMELILDKKIYFLCKKCHGETRRLFP